MDLDAVVDPVPVLSPTGPRPVAEAPDAPLPVALVDVPPEPDWVLPELDWLPALGWVLPELRPGAMPELGWLPELLGWLPELLGWLPELLGWLPELVCVLPELG